MAKERARRRAEREAQAQREREQRARQRARREKVDRGKEAVAALVPTLPSAKPGILAARRRRRLWALLIAVVLVQAIAWPLLPSWPLRLLLLVGTLLVAPIVWVLSFGRL